LLAGIGDEDILIGDFDDTRLPTEFARTKAFADEVHVGFPDPDIVLTHRLEDRHQDHRLVAELTWQTWRNQLILEYEIPKYEGDLGQPNVFVPVDDAVRRRKIDHLLQHFGSQRSKAWFDASTFDAMLRLRGVECRSDSGFAEAFHARKLTL
jgi:LmbE family N-acetylglucosaminyl deacetylase